MSIWSEFDEHAHVYAPGVLSFIDTDGFPFSLRVRARQDREAGVFRFPLPEGTPAVDGPAWLLWHHHDALLDDHHVLAVKGKLVQDDGEWAVRPDRVFASGYGDMSKIGERTEAYLVSRGITERPEIPWDELKRIALKAKEAS
ncbi:hypothetical protein [Kutzneria kofuensis]|uniref:Uncharacterized protein n=1 Tax=Kutzneria kofuensis TaxID=103725 RepID=A0A7W9KQY8_9PSEU|nr:hypothetical protein [Kutzneria kofuensis]MBB5897010.1 hypothetical protein [Kutzneria kofuensis]